MNYPGSMIGNPRTRLGKKLEKMNSKEYNKFYYNKNKNKLRPKARVRQAIKRKLYPNKAKEDYKKNYFAWLLVSINQRCKNKNHPKYKNYGGRGIQNFLTKKQIEYLWFRDKAYSLKKPSIDREDNDGNYELSNCRFIELSDNSKRKRSCLKKKNGGVSKNI